MDVTVRLQPGLDFGHVELIQTRIAELKASIAEGGPREAAIRALLYISQAGAGADERTFNTLRQIRSENDDLTLQAFKRTVREQYFKLRLDPEGALAAIPTMLSADPSMRPRVLDGRERRMRGAAARGRKAVQRGPARRPAEGKPQGSRQGRSGTAPEGAWRLLIADMQGRHVPSCIEHNEKQGRILL